MTVVDWPLFILSLPGDEDRRAILLKVLDESSLKYEIFFGVDGRNGLPECWEKHVNRQACKENMGRDLSDGELACALSHREIYRQIRVRGLPGAIILEDDAILSSDFSKFLQERLYDRAGLILLYHSYARVVGPRVELLLNVSMRRLIMPCFGATAYTISASVAKAFEKANTPVSTVSDWPKMLLSVGAMAVEPSLVGHPDFDAGLSHLRSDRNKTRARLSGLSRTTRRWFSLAYWKRWIIKRRSDRIS